jgi:hypothetical protein
VGPKTLRAIEKTGRHVKEENTLFSVKIIKAEVVVYTPNNLKTPASKYAYVGPTNAEGPVGSG